MLNINFSHHSKTIGTLLLASAFLPACSLTSNQAALTENKQFTELKNSFEQVCAQQNQSLSQLTKQHQKNEQTLSKIYQQISKTSQQTMPQCEEKANKLDGKIIIGELEWIYVPSVQRHIQARIDSGATTSSISAKNIMRFERDGENWVKFTLTHTEAKLDYEMEAKVVRTARIRQASSDKLERRTVIKLVVKLGSDLQQEAEFTLADRTDMEFPVLLGREFLQDVTLIEVGKSFIHPKVKS
ncbi:ATP-dependent zinc protease [Catenovulum agarivorans]|uniref:ATP-dependent zinc protease family protein n=1 Tax=Catenovulum agarivorans TaxID=1172192 RepID=UPI0002E497E7|nr:ATP-dependent zinc protease [Catenovulum agarivorans]